ncbi:Two-component signal transduction system YycFG, regulatory protein YycH [Marininema mesophilum]|uniref:Two-component signal transduction system YycFG, regulatory protein YycH n=1 Tax=Marininema mesophilum TaxID=1048340 RepID=A0A1H3AJ98_9BACL|nr:two-component system activity regulator YycH [Marininema mesophilum]SDX29511.1 Two-component signal transduction system YycFG, regulatory protein YycH [Marininema mesophilum]
MIDHIKSVLLTILILTSFVQSGILLYTSPSYEQVLTPDDYSYPHKIVKESFEKQGVHEIAAPSQILIHQNGKHQQIPGNLEKSQIRNLLSNVHLTELTRPQKVTPSNKDWNNLMAKKDGIELRFNNNLSPEIMQAFFTTDLPKPDLRSVSRVWIYQNAAGDQSARFISDETGKTVQYKATLESFADLIKVADKLNAPFLSATLPKKNSGAIPRPLYLPNDPLAVQQLRYPLKKITINDLKLALFPDPNLIEKKLTLDRATMYTDTTRTLQHNTAKNLITYNRPDSTTESEFSLTDQLDLIQQFMRRHEGWTGNFLLDDIENDPDQVTPFFRFRLYTNGLPVFWDGGEKITPATLRLSAVGKGVTSYDRSLFYPALQPDKKATKVSYLPDKKELLAELDRKGISLEKKVTSIYPGYRTDIKDQAVTFIPTWIIQLEDGTRNYVEKRSPGR